MMYRCLKSSYIINMHSLFIWLQWDSCGSLRKLATQKDKKLVYKTNYRLMQVKSIAEWEHSAIPSTFIKLESTFVLPNFEWLQSGLRQVFTVYSLISQLRNMCMSFENEQIDACNQTVCAADKSLPIIQGNHEFNH